MADEIVNIIHRFAFEVDTSSLDQIKNKFQDQITSIDEEKKRLADLEKQMAALGVTSGAAFDDLTAQINESKNALSDYSRQLLENIQNDKKLQSEIMKEIGLYQQLVNQENKVVESKKKLSSTSDVASDKVNALSRASFSLSQVFRELPSATYGWNVFALAISNNVPILVDDFKKLQEVEGSAESALTKLGGTIFSMTNIVTLAVSALAIFSYQMSKAADTTNEAEEAAKDYEKALKDLDKAQISQTSGETARLEAINAVLKDNNASQRKKLDLADELKTLYPVYLKNYSDEEIAAGKAGSAIENLTRLVEFQNKAEAETSKAAKSRDEFFNQIELISKAEKELTDFTIKRTNALLQGDQAVAAYYDLQVDKQNATIENLKKNLPALKANYDAQIDRAKQYMEKTTLLDEEEDKQKKERTKKDHDYTEQLNKEIAALDADYYKEQLKQLNQTADIRIKEISQANEAERQEKIDALKQEEKLIQGNTIESIQERELLRQKLFDINRNYDQKEIDEINKFWKEYYEKQFSFVTQMLQQREGADKERLNLIQKAGDDELILREKIVNETEEIALRKEEERYKKQIDEAKYYQYNLSDLEKTHQDNITNIQIKAQQDRIDETIKYYEKQQKSIEDDKDATIEHIKANATIITNVQRQTLQQNLTAAGGQLASANQEWRRVMGDPLATEDQKKAVQKNLDESKNAYKKAQNDIVNYDAQMVVDIISAANQAAQVVGQIENALYQKKIDLLDAEIKYREDRMGYAVELARRGNTAILESEQKRLDQANLAREKAAKRQIEINAALQASESLVAAATAISAVMKAASTGASEGGVIGLVVSVIGAIAAIAAAIISIRNAFTANETASFAEGGYTGSGGKYQRAGVVHRGEFVSHQRATSMYRPYLEMMNRGTFPLLAMDYPMGSQMSKDNKKMLEKLDEINDSINQNQVTVHNRMDGSGWWSMTERMRRTERRRWQ